MSRTLQMLANVKTVKQLNAVKKVALARKWTPAMFDRKVRELNITPKDTAKLQKGNKPYGGWICTERPLSREHRLPVLVLLPSGGEYRTELVLHSLRESVRTLRDGTVQRASGYLGDCANYPIRITRPEIDTLVTGETILLAIGGRRCQVVKQ